MISRRTGAFLLSQVATMDVDLSIKFVYPRLYRIHDMSEEVSFDQHEFTLLLITICSVAMKWRMV